MNKPKKYVYFVAYDCEYMTGRSGRGNCESTVGYKIESIKDIHNLEEAIKEESKLALVVVINFILLRVER